MKSLIQKFKEFDADGFLKPLDENSEYSKYWKTWGAPDWNLKKLYFYESCYNMGYLLKPKRVLEVGVAVGYSMCCFLKGCEDAKHAPDIFLGIDNERDVPNGNTHALKNLKKCNINFIPEILTMALEDKRSISRLNSEEKFDYIYLDGPHDELGAKQFDTVWPHLKDGGYIVIDDMTKYDPQADILKMSLMNKIRMDHGEDNGIDHMIFLSNGTGWCIIKKRETSIVNS